jgi:hypothetical protein
MKRLIVILAFAVLVLPLVTAGSSGSSEALGLRHTPDDPGYTASTAVDRVEISQYVAAVRPLYAALAGCTSSCDRLDFPPHRCPACASATASLTQIARQAALVQAKLARLDVPDSLVAAHSDLVAAASTMQVSAAYMAKTVRTAPSRLLVATYASPTDRGRGGVRVVWRESPAIVRDATYAAMAPTRVPTFASPPKGRGGVTIVWRELQGATSEARVAQLDRLGPAGVQRAAFVRARWAALTEMQRAGPSGTPAQQTMAYLVQWRDGVRAEAQEAGIRLGPVL